MEFEDAGPSEQTPLKQTSEGDGLQNDICTNDYGNLIIQMRKANLMLQQICRIPVGELTMLLTLNFLSGQTGAVQVSCLREAMKLSKPAVSRMLHTLEKKDCIQMKNDEEDQRYVMVYPTEKGKKVLQEEISNGYHLLQKVRERMGEEHMHDFLYYSGEFYRIMGEEISKKIR